MAPKDRLTLTSSAGGTLPADRLDVAARVTNPGGPPLDPERDAELLVDLSGVRGQQFVERIVRQIRAAGAQPTMVFVSGHVGAGKSTEMARLGAALGRVKHESRQSLRGTEIHQVHPKAQVIAFDAQPLIEQISDLDLEDLLIGLWNAVLEQRPAESAQLLGQLWKQRVASILKSTITNLPDKLAEALQRVVGSLRASDEERKKTRILLSSVADALIDGLNDSFEKLREDPGSPVVVLIDNLEKVSERRRDVVEHLYLERLGTLKKLVAHLVISAPSFLLLDPKGAGLTAAYGAETIFVPMVKVRRCEADGGGLYEEGVRRLVEVLTRRVNFDALFERGAEAAHHFAVVSGGRMRDALMLTYRALSEVDDPKVPWVAVERVIREEVQNRARGIPESWGKHLRAVAKTNRLPAECPLQDRADMLRGGHVLEYQNGDPAPFYVVHPLVEQTAVFRNPLP